MFASSGWFVIDAGNQQVKGVRVASLEAGLDLVGDGAVATVVGRLRPELRVVDVDLVGERGHAVAEQLTSWCRRADLWCLVRPSGGADGRCHVFIAPERHGEDLARFVDELRVRMRASARAIDLRRSGHVRPLCAPHRLGGHPRPLGDLRHALRRLKAHAWATSTSGHQRSPGRRRSAAGSAAALTAKPRRRSDLPAPWVTYLRTGVAPPHGGGDHSRSTDELLATAAMVRAGHTAETAWALIAAAHPHAMIRARSSRRRWIAWVWNRAVQDDLSHSSPSHGVDPAVAAATAMARARLQDLMWTLPPRRRRALLLVGHHVLDRMERNNSRRVPVPERNLVEDTCITDRKTIRAALRLLNGPVGNLHTDTWDPHRRDSSSYEFEIPSAHGGVQQIPPPSLHTPLPRGVWSQLPGPAHSIWRVLQTARSARDITWVAHSAGVTETVDQAPTATHLRTTTTALTQLARAGLADCTADGRWLARNTPATDQVERAAARHQEIADAVAAERATYRRPATEWHRAQARALKAQRHRERAWWTSLQPQEMTRRQVHWTAVFDQLPVLEQERLKAHLAQRRINAGDNEATRHDEWVDCLSDHDYLERSIARQRRFETLPPPLQQALAASWQRHRTRFKIRRGTPRAATRREHRELLPEGPQLRDVAFLDGQLRVVADTVEVPA